MGRRMRGAGSKMTTEDELAEMHQYALGVADSSYEWYRTRSIRSRRAFKASEFAVIIFSSAIPIVALFTSSSKIIPAVLGTCVVVLTSSRALFNWQENYLRFGRAREAVEAQRRLYQTRAEPYSDAETRNQILVAEITRIETEEMSQWLRIFTKKSKS